MNLHKQNLEVMVGKMVISLGSFMNDVTQICAYSDPVKL